MPQKKRFLPATEWWTMRLGKRGLEFRQKSGRAQAGAGGDIARGNDFSARKRTINQPTNQPTNDSTNESTKRFFGSMFAKARCARRKRRQFNALRQCRQWRERPEGYKKSLSCSELRCQWLVAGDERSQGRWVGVRAGATIRSPGVLLSAGQDSRGQGNGVPGLFTSNAWSRAGSHAVQEVFEFARELVAVVAVQFHGLQM